VVKIHNTFEPAERLESAVETGTEVLPPPVLQSEGGRGRGEGVQAGVYWKGSEWLKCKVFFSSSSLVCARI
jgi:hypothetical protein